ncbi:MAG: ABC transporter permease subunit [Mollicutes bacterium]|nr:ABC transporter permease subunit [Mollicutes bacterium]MDD7263649.1 ABC transporter permease subunit [bacterium]MDY4979252.1 ABC transporter permease subunit [Candidatus Onthovivens sp.]
MLSLKLKKKVKPYDEALKTISPLARHHKEKKWNKSSIELMTMVSFGIVFIAIFAYLPMFGLILAFKSGDGYLNIMQAIFESSWVGFDNFKTFFEDPEFSNVMLNTLGLNILQLCINFPLPIFFAILLSELPWKKMRKAIQVVTYFPYFLSWITYGAIILALINSDGIINVILLKTGIIDQAINFGEPQYFWATIIITSLLKGMGWGSVIYVAAIAGIDPQLFEAADMDGANRFYRIFHITIPSIAPTIILFFILSVSGLLNNGFDHIYTFQNQINLSKSEVLDTYIYKYGTVNLQYSYTTAVGLFKSIIAVILLGCGNFVAKKTTGSGIF